MSNVCALATGAGGGGGYYGAGSGVRFAGAQGTVRSMCTSTHSFPTNVAAAACNVVL